MTSQPGMTLDVRLTAPSLDFWVDVRLASFGDRWLATADIGGEHEIGLGRTARHALNASLSSLGDRSRSQLLADPALFRASSEVANATSR